MNKTVIINDLKRKIADAVQPLSDKDYIEVLETIAGDCEMMADAKREEMPDDE